MPDDWNGVFRSIQGQGKSPSPDQPKSPTDAYYAYLDKADWDVTTSTWFLMFDMVPAEAVLIGLGSDLGNDTPPPRLPTIIFHAHGVAKSAVYDALKIAATDEPAEGSWYALFLEKGGDPQTQLVGDLYHPDTDFLTGQPEYGQWFVSNAALGALPGPSEASPLFTPPPPSRRAREELVGGKTAPKTYDAVAKLPLSKPGRFKPFTKRVPLSLRRIPRVPPPPPPAPPPPGFGALGVMAIGQGGFNLLLERATREPLIYYDAGYPLGFYHSSVPNPMRIGNAAFQGPIMQNTAGTLRVILSHWDWDHWRFGAFTNLLGQTLANLPWTVPLEAMSPTAAMWFAGVAGGVAVAPNSPAQAGPNGLTLYKLQPGAAPHPFYINNSGLAITVPVDLATAQSAGTALTGDANFNFLPGGALAGVRIVGAVHHGSSNHGAAANIPLPPAGTTGRVAYSYGITAAGNHAYGFPTAAAVAAYRGANWTAPTEQATAEGPNINVGPAAAGNIRIGDQGALPATYGGTAFAAIGYALP